MKLSVSQKLYGGFFIVLILLVGIVTISYTQMKDVDDSYSDLIDNRAKKVSMAKDLLLAVKEEQVSIRSYLLTADEKYTAKLETAKAKYKQVSGIYNKMVDTAQGRDSINQMDQLEMQYNQTAGQAMRLKQQGNTEEAVKIAETQAAPLVEKMVQTGESLIETQQNLLDQGSSDNSKQLASTLSWLLIIGICAIGAGSVVAFYISRQISIPIMSVARAADKIANGDLTDVQLNVKNRDEIGQMAAAFNKMADNLRHMIGSVLSSAQSLSSASEQISASTEEIASGSSNQANSAQTMNELFKELSFAINSVARGAEQAAELSNKTMSLAQEGSKVLGASIEGMLQANEQMSRLEQDSNTIGEIIEVIDDIADQTNLLALNAAIEAARAGDQGRGFAVVAAEVRKLAERSSEATKQITAIIKGMQQNTKLSITAVNTGVASSQKTGESFERIVTMVNESAYKVTEIAAASEEQAAQTTEVLIAIETISAATEETAASSQETAAAAQSLAVLAEELNSLVDVFKI
ncbi:methyl-accepting chemotaxis protein [Paenibacillus planticolens]|uniref:HAMP domain-containing protein n=1 Tax=Paenibacillus planticolens TaxID=2654976 RepID=A0ABX1ZPX7_9BACL|nr:methyl-accepting chemotaxis protein [Paenibacillus planticolens]NOV02139.1 HAMP domain-containing protein [Paenibacillus planticolens]